MAKRQAPQVEDDCAIKIPDHGTIQMMSDGAFVEALIWIPKEVADKETV